MANRAEHVWEDGALGGWLHQASQRCNVILMSAEMTSRVEGSAPDLTQSRVSVLMSEAHRRLWQKSAGADARCTLNAYSTNTSGKLLGAAPSQTLDKNLSNTEFHIVVAMRLGVDVCGGGLPCRFCGMMMDSKGRHALSCMSGGDCTLEHNEVRDAFFDYCRRAHIQPDREAPGLWNELSTTDGRRRPADVLVCGASAFPRALPDGSQVRRHPRIAFDFAIINALGRQHWEKALDEPGLAVEAYAQKKRRHQDTARKCDQLGIWFQPLVFDAQGGMTSETAGVLHQLANAVAHAENLQLAACKEDMLQRFAVIVDRASARAILRRRAVPTHVGEVACRRAANECATLEA